MQTCMRAQYVVYLYYTSFGVLHKFCVHYRGWNSKFRFYAVPPNYAVLRGGFFPPKNRVEWGEYCTIKNFTYNWPKEKWFSLKVPKYLIHEKKIYEGVSKCKVIFRDMQFFGKIL